MKIEEINLNVNEITADEGKKLTDGNGYYSKVFLSNIDRIENYTEVDEADILSFGETEESDELEN